MTSAVDEADQEICIEAKGLAGAPAFDGSAAVLIKKGIIVALGREAINSGAPIKRLPNAWLCPALLDPHVHLWLGGGLEANLAKARAAGLAAVRDMGCPKSKAVLGCEHKPGPPYVVSCGTAMGPAGPGKTWLAKPCSGPDEFHGHAHKQCQNGAGCLKIFASGLLDFDNPGKVLHPLAMGEDEIAAVVAAAATHKLPVVAHASGVETVKAAVLAGVGSIEHGFFLGKDTLGLMAERGVFWSPTLAAVVAHVRDDQRRHTAEERKRINKIVRMQMHSMRLAEELGVQMTLGTDAGSYGLPHGEAVFLEMDAWLKAGVKPKTVFKAATEKAAKSMGLEHDLGSLSPGSMALIMACAKNPQKSPLEMRKPVWAGS